MRRILTVLLLVAIALAAGWTLYQWKRPSMLVADPWRAVPTRAAVVLSLPDAWAGWDRFTHTSQLWGTVEQIPSVAASGRVLLRAAERMEQDAALRDAFQGTPVLVTLLRGGGNTIGCIFSGILPTNDKVPLHTITGLLGGDAAGAQALAQGGTIQLAPDSALPMLSMAIRQGAWIIASSPEMMEEALLQWEQPPITGDPIFASALLTLGGGSDGHLLVHTGRARHLLHTWWRTELADGLDLPIGWAALDLRSRPDAMLMSGLLMPESEHRLLTALPAQGTGQHALARLLPSTVAQLQVQHIADAPLWLSERHGTADDAAAEMLFHWVEGSMGLAIAPGDATRPTLEWALLPCSDPDLAAEALQRFCQDALPCDTLVHRDSRMTRLSAGGAYERLLGKGFANFEQPWWVLIGNVVLLSNDPDALRASIDAWHDGNSLAENPRYTTWHERIGRKAGLMVWCDVARMRDRLAAGMKPEHAADMTAEDAPWTELGGATLQLSPGQRGHFHLVVGLQHAPLEARSTGVLWSTPLDATVSHTPHIVRNHTNDTREVLVQDDRHRLHLLGSTGKILWTRQLEGMIMGGVTQVDRFRNGKLQLVFNTAEKLYLVDRNGRDVGGFPVDLKGGATAPVAVLDYDQERDYRLVVPTGDGRLLNFGGDGLAVKGWEPASGTGASTNMVRHLRIRNKDHLLMVDATGKVRLLDRRGQVREPSELLLGEGAAVQHMIPGSTLEHTRLVWSLPDGSLLEATLHGTPTVLVPGGKGTAIWADPFNDGTGAVVHLTGDSLILLREGRPWLTRAFGNELRGEARVYPLSKDSWAISALRPTLGQLTLVDPLGHDLEGLPLPGVVSPAIADLNLDGRRELVTVTAEGVVVAYRVPAVSGPEP